MWFNEQEREQMEYEFGMASEAQNAFAWGQMNRAPDDSAAINTAVAAGSFVAVAEGASYCPYTDAINGSRKSLLGISDTYAGALSLLEAAVGDDPDPAVSYYVLPALRAATESQASPAPAASDDDIPF